MLYLVGFSLLLFPWLLQLLLALALALTLSTQRAFKTLQVAPDPAGRPLGTPVERVADAPAGCHVVVPGLAGQTPRVEGLGVDYDVVIIFFRSGPVVAHLYRLC